MEILKRSVIVLVFSGVLFVAQGQQAKYNELIKAFSKSYELESEGDYTNSLKVLKAYHTNDMYEVNLRLGWLSYLLGDYPQSITYYKTAAGINAFAIEPKIGLAYPLAAIGDVDGLIFLYKGVLEIAPGNTQAMYQLGLVYFNRGEYELADKYFSRIVNLFPFDYDGLLMLAQSSFKLKKYREAKVLFNKVLMNSPQDAVALAYLKLLE